MHALLCVGCEAFSNYLREYPFGFPVNGVSKNKAALRNSACIFFLLVIVAFPFLNRLVIIIIMQSGGNIRNH